MFVKHLKRIFRDPATLELFAFRGTRQIKSDDTHSFTSYYMLKGRKTWPRSSNSSEAPEIPVLKAYDKCLERKIEYELLTPSPQR